MVRPIDLQDALSKTQAVLKITESTRANPENEQRTALVLTDQKQKDDQKKTLPTQHSDEVILHRDKPDEKGKQESPEKKAEDEPEEMDNAPAANASDDDEPLPPPSLDITV